MDAEKLPLQENLSDRKENGTLQDDLNTIRAQNEYRNDNEIAQGKIVMPEGSALNKLNGQDREIALRATEKGLYVRSLSGSEGSKLSPNPFDDKDYVDMTGIREIRPENLIQPVESQKKLAENALSQDFIDNKVGTYSNIEGVLAWVTAEQRLQATTYDEKLANHLEAMGYKKSEWNLNEVKTDNVKVDSAVANGGSTEDNPENFKTRI